MKLKIAIALIFFPLFVFGQSSATDSFELNITVDRSIRDFENIEVYSIYGTGITSCYFHLDSLEHTDDVTKLKLYGEYRYIGGANAVFPTFILSEKTSNSVQHYLIRSNFSLRKVPNENPEEQKSELTFIQLIESMPFIELAKNEDDSVFMRNYKLLAELQSATENEYLFLDLFHWIKINAN